MVDDFRKDLGVTVNPRYGVLKDGKLVPDDGGGVDILETTPPRRRGRTPPGPRPARRGH